MAGEEVISEILFPLWKQVPASLPEEFDFRSNTACSLNIF